MRGKIYGVGVGPGDPELMTPKAACVLREADVIAVPVRVAGDDPAGALAYQIAVQAVPEIAGKQLLGLDVPMVVEREGLAAAHASAVEAMAEAADRGRSIAYLTIGDPTLYCSFSYLEELLEERGYEVELVSGVPSICAAAARAGISLAQWDEPLHIIPAAHLDETGIAEQLAQPGACVLMKASRNLPEMKAAIRASGREAIAVEHCGLEGEHTYHGIDAIPDKLPYLSIVIVR